MSSARSLPVLVSIVVSAGLWALGVALMPAEGRGAGFSSRTYAALICSESVPDREIRERLENQGFTGLVSESGQWVLLDSFGGIERIPLDEYDSRVLPFDPRNDGYAHKLRTLFVQDGKRFIYIPLGSALPVKLAIIEKRLAVSLGDIPYSFEYSRSDRHLGLFIAVFCLVAGAFFIIRPLRRALEPHTAGLIPCLPALAPLALGGAAGFALASLLAGFAVLLAGRYSKQRALPHRRESPPAPRRLLRGLLPFMLMICYGIIIIFSGLPLVFTLLVLAFLCGILIFSLRGASRSMVFGGVFVMRQNSGYQRFAPVPILKRRSSAFAFVWAMLPFAAAALVLAITGAAAPASAPAVFTPLPSAAAVSEADYHTHYVFQSTFSQRTLHAHTPAASGGMSVFELADDDLIGHADNNVAAAPAADMPPFSLNDLLRFLGNP